MPDFMRYKAVFFIISAFFLVPGLASLFLWGFKPAIDFTGGSLFELEVTGEVTEIERVFDEKGVDVISIQTTGTKGVLVRTESVDEKERGEILATLKERFGKVEITRFETVGPTLGQELLVKTLIGIGLAAVLIMFYVAWRFKDKMYGVCAILAMFHDTFIVLGIFSLLGHFYGVEVDTLFVTAALTVLSFSVHDTVVVYDRIRELRKLYPRERFADVVNRAITDTLTRSVNNSLTIIFMLLALLLLSGETIRWFVVALLVGTIAGTYSSTFTAAPLLVVWYNRLDKAKS